jgi:hypothetical protein
LHLIVRRVRDKKGVREERVLMIAHTDTIEEDELHGHLTTSLRNLLREAEQPEAKAGASKPVKKKAKKSQRKKRN